MSKRAIDTFELGSIEYGSRKFDPMCEDVFIGLVEKAAVRIRGKEGGTTQTANTSSLSKGDTLVNTLENQIG